MEKQSATKIAIDTARYRAAPRDSRGRARYIKHVTSIANPCIWLRASRQPAHVRRGHRANAKATACDLVGKDESVQRRQRRTHLGFARSRIICELLDASDA